MARVAGRIVTGEQAIQGELDIECAASLRSYLTATGRCPSEQMVDAVPLSGGVSNKVMWLRRKDGAAWVLKQALPKLRVQTEWFCDPARIDREALGTQWLARLVPGSVPPLVFHDAAHHVLAMEAVPQPHENWKSLLLAGRMDPDLGEQWGRLLGGIHAGSAARSQELARLFGDRGFFETLRVEPYYRYAASKQPEAAGFLDRLIDDMRGRRLTLVHGDFSPKNMLLHGGRLMLLDHEVVHWGDPAFDVGFAMTHLLSKAHHLPPHRAALAVLVEHFLRGYGEAVGEAAMERWEMERYGVGHTLGCLLARVAGRSPLEYLRPAERSRQLEVVTAMMASPPTTLRGTAGAFLDGIEQREGQATDAED